MKKTIETTIWCMALLLAMMWSYWAGIDRGRSQGWLEAYEYYRIWCNIAERCGK